jgi:iron complex outermembrane recepter protein
VNKIFCLSLLISFQVAFAQELDTAKTLDEVVIKAFAHDRPLLDVPASVASIGQLDLQRFSNTNFLPALNAQPGVRMEERSPGSYRLSIRGSTLRSPFGVRNVKVYYQGMPLTNHGGETYLNILDFGSVADVEVIKGPGSSLYGAGTGGVVLLSSQPKPKDFLTGEITGGSYGLLRYRFSASQSSKRFSYSMSYASQQADGYRNHSKMERNVFSFNLNSIVTKRTTASLTILNSDLYYQTPGGLNQLQYDTLPTQARANADVRKAAIYNQSVFSGINIETEWNKHWLTSTVASLLITDFKNPTFLNYEKRDEQTFSLRHQNEFTHQKGKLVFGIELQQGRSKINVGQNNNGSFVDTGGNFKIPTITGIVFAQHDYQLPANVLLTTGISFNQLTTDYKDNQESLKRKLDPIFSPRVALLKKLTNTISTYFSFNRGYSPPGRNELFPSTAVYDPKLKPEFGNSYESGLKANWKLLEGSFTLYSFDLRNTIIKLDSAGADYFTNAGRSLQNGIEVLVKINPGKAFSSWASYSYNHYRFKEYERDEQDFPGNPVTGVPEHIVVAGFDVRLKNWYVNLTMQHVSKTSVNDANTVQADAYTLAGLRTGYKMTTSKIRLEFFGGADNLLDVKYSLGNDINAAGNRYFNAAPTRNFYVGLTAGLVGRR